LLLLDTDNASHRGNNGNFRFELSWLTQVDFHETIAKVWQEENRDDTPMKWQNNRFLRGWAKNVVGKIERKNIFWYNS
jgi:Rps23 Pro-64 3,4-dihydroxylase Tpa1-like proline 4-hydroxylase